MVNNISKKLVGVLGADILMDRHMERVMIKAQGRKKNIKTFTKELWCAYYDYFLEIGYFTEKILTYNWITQFFFKIIQHRKNAKNTSTNW